jgi:predicted dehydrogenase
VDVFCEKIMAESIASGEAMMQPAAERGRVLAVNFNWRFLPGIQKIREIEEAGTLCELWMLRIVCHSWVWHHLLDIVIFLGGKPVGLTAQCRQDSLFEDRGSWWRFADELLYLPGVYGMAMLETKEGVGASITSSNLWNPPGCLFGLDAIFRRGVITLSGVHMADALGILSCDQKEADLHLTLEETRNARTYAITFKRSITAFMDAYLQGKSPPTSGEDALFTMRMERAVVESATTGRKVCFP